MANDVYEALLGAVLREREEKNRLRIPELEALRIRLRHRGLDDYEYRLREPLTTLVILRILKRRRILELGYASGAKDIPLSLDEVLRKLLRRLRNSDHDDTVTKRLKYEGTMALYVPKGPSP